MTGKKRPVRARTGTPRRRAAARAAVLGLCLVTIATLAGTGRPGQPLAIIAYVHGGGADIDSSAVCGLTHINFSFLHFMGNQLVVGGSRDSMAIVSLVGLKAKNPALRVLLSVGGWGGCEPCSEIASTREGRQAFAASAKELIEQFGADGIDLDWEYPAIEGFPGHRFVSEDRHNFTLLVQELRKVLGSSRLVTFAAGGFTDYLKTSIEWDQVMPLVDMVNVMTYDLVNGYSTVTGHHTPLFSCAGQLESTDHAVRFLDSIGVPRRKIIIGAAFYGRVWEGVTHENNGLFQGGTFKAFVPFKQLGSYFEAHGPFTMLWDSVAQAPYAYSESEGLFATYDDERSVARKTTYAIELGLGGIMFWELSGDRDVDGLLGVIVETAARRSGEQGRR